ncbi:MAG TPA: hypothetical protein VFL99_15635 [Segeticoccus sp.]|uniref:hypothetical protein n=1 Tax=Segeticoccus sp. TaxID=2706531 RepID=UPI002D7E7B96|nr:hypothetical protein [Segeticoccus sp.]HET8601759.1 hypothetical protein [Segeticoccus sp.]
MSRAPLPEDPILEAWRAGFEYGQASRAEFDVEDEIRRRVMADSAYWGDYVRTHALRRHGPAWAALVCGDDDRGAA